MLVVTNRKAKIAPGASGDGKAMGEQLHRKAPGQLTFLTAEAVAHPIREQCRTDRKQWRVDRLEEAAFTQHLQQLATAHPAVLMVVHGFDQTFCKALYRGALLEEKYGLPVVLFTWPSCPRVLPRYSKTDKSLRYLSNRARRNARRSAPALAAAIRKTAKVMQAESSTSFNLFVHSMGNLVLKKAALRGYFDDAPAPLARHVIIHQSDVPFRHHHHWLQKVPATQTIITRNCNDEALALAKRIKWSTRLGGSSKPSKLPNVISIDLTHTPNVGDAHMIPLDCCDHPHIHQLFHTLFTGQSPNPADHKTTRITFNG